MEAEEQKSRRNRRGVTVTNGDGEDGCFGCLMAPLRGLGWILKAIFVVISKIMDAFDGGD